MFKTLGLLLSWFFSVHSQTISYFYFSSCWLIISRSVGSGSFLLLSDVCFVQQSINIPLVFQLFLIQWVPVVEKVLRRKEPTLLCRCSLGCFNPHKMLRGNRASRAPEGQKPLSFPLPSECFHPSVTFVLPAERCLNIRIFFSLSLFYLFLVLFLLAG